MKPTQHTSGWISAGLSGESGRGSVRLALMVMLAVCAGSTNAHAQFFRGGPATGGGNLLSRNLQRGGGGGGLTRDEVGRSMLNFRNSVIYGNAGGGLAFQGSIPYTAPDEFRGKLQSDALYAFRRDSFYSSVANSGVRSGDALAYRRSLTIGGQRPQGVEGSLSVPRSGTPRAFNPASYGTPGQGAIGRSVSDYGLPSLGGAGNMVRRSAAGASQTSQSTLSQLKASALQNATGVQTRSGLYSQDDYNLTGDNLQGRMSNYVPQLGTSDDLMSQRSLKAADTLRQQTERISAAAAKAQNADQAGAQPAGPARASGGPVSSIPAPAMGQTNTTYDELRQRIQKLLPAQPADTPGSGPASGANTPNTPASLRGPATGPSAAMLDFQKQISDLSDTLRGDAARVNLGATARSRLGLALTEGGAAGTGVKTGTDANAPATRPFERVTLGPDGQPLPSNERLGPTIDPKTLQIIRSAGATVDTFIPGGAARRELYGESMEAGQQALAQGRYFDAEERFARANAMRRGDTTSTVGMLHSQIGSGMVLSAGRTLRNLIADHPEITAMRYAENLRPSAARTAEIVERLRTNIAGATRMRRDSALLLAYVGYQGGDRAMVTEGLDALAKIDADERAADPTSASDARLVELLRGVWLPDDSQNEGAAPGDPRPGSNPDQKPDPDRK